MNKLIRLFSRIKEWAKRSIEIWQKKARTLKCQTYTIYLAYKDPRVPWFAKLLAIFVIGYAFSPIDLIPDFIPILGYVDDLILIPLGIKLIIKLIPAEVLAQYQAKAAAEFNGQPKNWYAAIIIMIIWLVVLVWIGFIIWQRK